MPPLQLQALNIAAVPLSIISAAARSVRKKY
jgi:hypothetical protein